MATTTNVPVTRVLSGIQPTGQLTLGNYLGAMKNFVKLQHEAECYFCIVDMHALTVPQDPKALYNATLDLARIYVAAGIDPEVATIFVQSHVPAHTELGWLMECSSYVGELGRMTQFKDKSAKQEVVTTGLMTYPCLMAADILIYQASHVPVGEDQRQHMELTRDIATRLNHRFGDFVTVPEPYIPSKAEGGRIMALTDPTKKMSKSLEDPNGNIFLMDPPKVILNKVKRAVTDLGREVVYDEENKPGVSNLMVLLSLCTGQTMDEISAKYDGYGQFKKDVAEAIIGVLEPIQQRVEELRAPGVIEEILAKGADKAEAVATKNLAVFREKFGLVPRRAR